LDNGKSPAPAKDAREIFERSSERTYDAIEFVPKVKQSPYVKNERSARISAP
jgi:hypothetical protein